MALATRLRIGSNGCATNPPLWREPSIEPLSKCNAFLVGGLTLIQRPRSTRRLRSTTSAILSLAGSLGLRPRSQPPLSQYCRAGESTSILEPKVPSPVFCPPGAAKMRNPILRTNCKMGNYHFGSNPSMLTTSGAVVFMMTGVLSRVLPLSGLATTTGSNHSYK